MAARKKESPTVEPKQYQNHGAEMKRTDDAVAADVKENHGQGWSPFSFDLEDLDSDIAEEIATDKSPEEMQEALAERLMEPAKSTERNFGVLDIETGGLPVERLAELFTPKTAEEFAATCDKRWKPETVAEKFHEYEKNSWQEFVDKAALSPITGRVLLIGMLNGGPIFLYDPDEARSLRFFWAHVENWLADKKTIVGHNSNSFDLPFLIRRSWCLGVEVPREIFQGRYFNPLFKDTMEIWQCGSREYTSLDTLAAFFGIAGKTEGIKGKDFSKWWYGQMPIEECGTPDQQRAKAIEYNGQDLKVTAAIAEKMGMGN